MVKGAKESKGMRGNGEDHAAPSSIEALGRVVELERARGAGRGFAGGGGNDSGGGGRGGGPGDGGDDLGPVDGRTLISSLRQMAELQSNLLLKTADAMVAALKDERDARREEAFAMAKHLGEEITRGLNVNARMAEATGDALAAFDARIKRLERIAAERKAGGG
jgi:hypothetical protein